MGGGFVCGRGGFFFFFFKIKTYHYYYQSYVLIQSIRIRNGMMKTNCTRFNMLMR